MQSKSVEAAIVPSGENLIDRLVPEHEAGDYIFDGRFYQTLSGQEYDRRQAVVDHYLETEAVSSMGIGEYQQWTELDWKKPHGTYEAVERWGEKINEEAARETPDALYEYTRGVGDTTALKQAAIGELGDTLWVLCAFASNAGQSTDRALQRYLWGDGKLSHREDQLTFGHIDGFVAEGLTPWFSPLDEIEPPEDNIEFIKYDEMEPHKNLLFRSAMLAMLCKKQYRYGNPPHDYFSVSSYTLMGREEIAPQIADQIVLVAWYARHFLDTTLTEVAKANIQKLRVRVVADRVDKSDGDRSTLTGN